MSIEAEDAKKLGVNALHKVLAANGVTVGAPSGSHPASPIETNGLTKFWEAK